MRLFCRVNMVRLQAAMYDDLVPNSCVAGGIRSEDFVAKFCSKRRSSTVVTYNAIGGFAPGF